MSTSATAPRDTNGVLEQVAELVRQTLALPETEPIEPEQLLFYDLGFTSMDLLDLLFRIEQHFQIRIPEGTIYQLARGDMPEGDFAHEGVLSEAGRRKLMELLHDSPAEIFPARIHASTLPRYCTVAAFVRLVEHKLASG
ncbi:MAG TPA: acyl carrier protein [Pyrinomonadaceae bacterium]|nr:acyl carrier protein [Pyrinomonadaceae bacterium]